MATYAQMLREAFNGDGKFEVAFSGDTAETPEREACMHAGVFATGPVPGTEHCGTCNTEVSRTEL